MKRFTVAGAIVTCAAFGASVPADAQATPVSSPSDSIHPAVGTEVWASTDSDGTDVVKLVGRALWDFEGPDKYAGIALEQAWFTPQGQYTRVQKRAYLDAADKLSSTWRWRARVGTNGKTVLGSATLRAADWSKEIFVEREAVETPKGLDGGIYYTLLGASADLPLNRQNILNGMIGYQDFTGKNERLHFRGSFLHVLDASHGLSLQLRGRYFHSTRPGEFDYYSPRNFVQLMPVLQMRRFDRSGWMYLAALGYGAEKGTASGWQSARFADLRLESPASSVHLQLFGEVQYSNNSLTGAAANYHYVVTRFGLTARMN